MQSVLEHYSAVGQQYDALYQSAMTAELPIIQEPLQLKPDDVMVDIGGGTGWFAHRLWKAAGLKEPVLCVDPSAEMLEEAKRYEGVTTIQATAEEFFSQPQELKFTKALMNGMFHHLSNPTSVLQGVWKSLKPDGRLVLQQFDVEERSPDEVYFRAAIPALPSADSHSREELKSLIEMSAPFTVQINVVEVEEKIPKAQWYWMLRSRFISPLTELSDQEIEDGINELEKERFGALKDNEPITKRHKALIVVATK